MLLERNIRKELEFAESINLAPYATLSSKSLGRDVSEAECPIRTCFQRDRDRILHCDSFQRLKKTQVITTALTKNSDHYKTRMTHSLEVAQIGRVIAQCLKLNTDLVEAAGLGHDLGHTPFGHTGEDVLNKRYEFGFKHTIQSVRVVEKLEKDGKGLNLTKEVREAIANHSGISNDLQNVTLETKILPFADKIAYMTSDLEDAIQYGLISRKDIPLAVRNFLGNNKSDIINSLVYDIINTSYGKPIVKMNDETFLYMCEFRNWLFKNVYHSAELNKIRENTHKIINFLCDYYEENYHLIPWLSEPNDIKRSVCDYVAGMTDEFALSTYEEHYFED